MRERLLIMKKRRVSLSKSYHDIAKVAKMTGKIVHDIEQGVIEPLEEDVCRIEEAIGTIYLEHKRELDILFVKSGKLF